MHITAEENTAGVSAPRTTVHPLVRHVRNVTVSVFALVAATALAVLLASRGPSAAGLDILGREILTVTSGSMEPEFRTGDAIAIRHMMNMVLGIDHRATDGAQGGRFLADIKRWLESVDDRTPIW